MNALSHGTKFQCHVGEAFVDVEHLNRTGQFPLLALAKRRSEGKGSNRDSGAASSIAVTHRFPIWYALSEDQSVLKGAIEICISGLTARDLRRRRQQIYIRSPNIYGALPDGAANSGVVRHIWGIYPIP